MRKFMLLAAAVALVAALVAVPALADHRDDDLFDDDDGFVVFFDDHRFFDDFDKRFDDRFFEGPAGVEQGFEQEAESGDVDLSFSTENTGDNSNVCAPALQFGNTGNLQNQQGFTSIGNGGFDFDGDGFFDFFDFDGNGVDDVEFEGSSMEFAPELATACDQAVQQAAAASSW